VTFRRDDQNAAKPTFHDSIQSIQSHLYATTGFIQSNESFQIPFFQIGGEKKVIL